MWYPTSLGCQRKAFRHCVNILIGCLRGLWKYTRLTLECLKEELRQGKGSIGADQGGISVVKNREKGIKVASQV